MSYCRSGSQYTYIYTQKKSGFRIGCCARTNTRIIFHSPRKLAWLLYGFTKHGPREVVFAPLASPHTKSPESMHKQCLDVPLMLQHKKMKVTVCSLLYEDHPTQLNPL